MCATLLQDKNLRGRIQDVDTDLSDEDMAQEINEYFGSTGITAKRFVDRHGIKRPTVLLTFNKKDQLERAINQGIYLGHSHYAVSIFKPKVNVTQCYNCYGFDHTAIWCPKTHKVCPYCSQHHTIKDCLIRSSNDRDQLKCPNCKDNNKHAATDPSCPVFKSKLNYITSITST